LPPSKAQNRFFYDTFESDGEGNARQLRNLSAKLIVRLFASHQTTERFTDLDKFGQDFSFICRLRETKMNIQLIFKLHVAR